MGKVGWTAEAEAWLEEIHGYIAQGNPDAALRTVQGIYERAQILTDVPEIGSRYLGRPDSPVRILVYGHYRIAYVVKPDGDVDILGVFHGALDIERFL